MSSSVGKYIGILLSSREQAHVFHLMTKSYAQHKALQVYYESIVPLLDSYAETYMGKSRKTLTGLNPYINRKIYTDAKFAQKYFLKLLKSLKTIKLPRDSALDNIRQEIDALVKQTIYMLSLH
jgi:hypothetical protein